MYSMQRQLKIVPDGERALIFTRAFNAPRALVWRAHTEPALVQRWLLGPDGWTMPVCEMDVRVGGKYRWVWRHGDGREMGMGGVYKEVKAPERLVSTEKFDQAWYPGEMLGTIVLTEKDGWTLLTQTALYESREVRDLVAKSPMESGVKASYDRMEQVLATLV